MAGAEALLSILAEQDPLDPAHWLAYLFLSSEERFARAEVQPEVKLVELVFVVRLHPVFW